jgi:uncharacterized protein (TIGR00369 family)
MSDLTTATLKAPPDIDPDRFPRRGLDLMLDAVAGRISPPPAASLLGWEALEMRPGFARVQYTATREFYNPHGSVQGGFLAAMLDDVMGPAALTLVDEETFGPTLDMNVSFLRPAHAGTLIAEGSVVHQSRRFVRVEGRLMTEDGVLIATSTATIYITQSNGGTA